jgi:hypothetical protein
MVRPVLIGLYSSAMRSGKSTVAIMLTERLFGMTQSFAAPFYDFIIQIAAPFIGSEMETRAWLSDERKDTCSDPRPGRDAALDASEHRDHWGRECVHRNSGRCWLRRRR